MFTQNSFGPMSAQANSDMPKTWSYRTTDTQAEVQALNYFTDKRHELTIGDFVHVDCADSTFTGCIAGTIDALTLGLTGVLSSTTGVTGADQITNMISLTQAEYDAITTPDASTFYVIVG